MFLYHRDELMTGKEIKQESGEFKVRLQPTETRLPEIIR